MALNEEKRTNSFHNVIMENRRRMSVSGVEEVDSFDESSVSLYTQMGMLLIKGKNLHINKLNVDTGELIIEGEIVALIYSDGGNEKKTGGFFGKLFK